MQTKNFTQYIQTYYGRELLKTHDLSEYGIWRVYGEDPNCDLGGHHYMPNLGSYEGTLEDVITMAVEIPAFWTWGGGGRIDRVNIEKIDSSNIKIRNEKLARLKELEKELADLKRELSIT